MLPGTLISWTYNSFHSMGGTTMRKILLCSLFCLCSFPLTASAQVAVDSPEWLAAMPAHAELLRSFAAGELGVRLPDALDLGERGRLAIVRPAQVINSTACGRREFGFLEGDDFVFEDGSFFDVYQFAGLAGYQVTVDMGSNDFDTFLGLFDGDGDLLDEDDDSGPGTNSRVQFTLPADGVYVIVANSLFGDQRGPYELTLRCEGTLTNAPPCTDGLSDALCLTNDRFAVVSAWATDSDSGTGTAVPLTDDTGYFWFFSANNVEVVTKVLNACIPSLGNRFWVFSGGLTNVQTLIRVVDTQEDQFVDYVNNPNTPFQPIQDTNAFATCP